MTTRERGSGSSPVSELPVNGNGKSRDAVIVIVRQSLRRTISLTRGKGVSHSHPFAFAQRPPMGDFQKRSCRPLRKLVLDGHQVRLPVGNVLECGSPGVPVVLFPR